MKTLSDLEPDVMLLPESERATLAARLLSSLPAVLADDDEGMAEAIRRDEELEHDPGSGITWDELRRSLKP